MSAQQPPIKATTLSRPFWEATKQRRFMLQYDPKVERYQFYPRSVSLYSIAPLEWREAKGTGTVIAVSTCHVPGPGFAEKSPYVLAIVQLSEGPRVFGRVRPGIPARALSVGQAVKIGWGEIVGDGREYLFEPA